MRIGFLAWNKFQVAQVQPLLENLGGQVTLVYQSDRPAPDVEILTTPFSWCSVLTMKKPDINQIDGLFDILLTQTSLPEAARFTRTKVVAVQYSMTKERHQYGPWHFIADARLVYGPYSAEALSIYGNTYEIGNPRFDIILNETIDHKVVDSIRNTLDPLKKTILYVPTWGKLSSFDAISPALETLKKRYNFIISGHHNTMLREKDRAQVVEENQPSSSVDMTPYYHHVADLVISDYSGALFDAILAQKPVVMFRPNHAEKLGVENLTEDSAEIVYADMIGPVVGDVASLIHTLDYVLKAHPYKEKNEQLRAMCFSNPGSAGPAGQRALLEIYENPPVVKKQLKWIRASMAK